MKSLKKKATDLLIRLGLIVPAPTPTAKAAPKKKSSTAKKAPAKKAPAKKAPAKKAKK